ncbi:uncharacterized protein LOC141630830 [Silene latifolia]|uniref:uncharacterized protein LOC141630830 n=1 Tax=Silene latifolia TaxID=37657 RepID=UPI003D77B20C
MSWGARSIAWGLELIQPNLGWNVGNKSTLNVWTSKWVENIRPSPKDRDLLEGCPNLSLLLVKHLMNNNGPSSDEQRVFSFFDNYWAYRIMAIPLSSSCVDDSICWEGSTMGSYLVKTGYFMAHQRHWNLNASAKDLSRLNLDYRFFVPKFLWRLPGPRVWSFLLWKILTDTLPIGNKFSKRNIDIYSTSCPLSVECANVETLDHLFRDCPVASRLWMGSLLGIRFDNCAFINIKTWIINWITFLLKSNDNGREISSFLCTLWTIWKMRNSNIFNSNRCSAIGAMFIYEANLNIAISSITNLRKDSPPGFTNMVKDVDTEEDGSTTRFSSSTYAQSPEQADGKGLLEVLKWARKMKHLYISIASDCN